VQRVWVLKNQQVPKIRGVEIQCVKSFDDLREKLSPHERILLLANIKDWQKLPTDLAQRVLAKRLISERTSEQEFGFLVRALLQDAEREQDLAAAEAVAWSGGSSSYDDADIELLGEAVLELANCRDMIAVEEALSSAANKIAPIQELKLLVDPPYASAKILGKYQLAVPIHFGGQLKAHIYVATSPDIGSREKEKIGELFLNLGDVIALAIARDQILSQAEQTKAVWEASFDAVEDPVAILDESMHVIRANRAYGKLMRTPIVKIHGHECSLISPAEFTKRRQSSGDSPAEWVIHYEGKHYLVYFDEIQESAGPGRYVLRLHDQTQERALTDKILAREQGAEMGILAASVAHEINNPIGGILALGQIMLKDLDKHSQTHKDLTDIVHAAERCKKIVQTMLSLVRKSDEAKVECDIVAMIDAVATLLAPEMKRLQVQLKIDSEKNFMLVANKNRLTQVFVHLLQQSLNAINERRKQEKFVPVLGITLAAKNKTLEIRIEDNGSPVMHEYESLSSVGAAVSQMILEEEGGGLEVANAAGSNIKVARLPLEA
jgi:signal transduction histidine kinase